MTKTQKNKAMTTKIQNMTNTHQIKKTVTSILPNKVIKKNKNFPWVEAEKKEKEETNSHQKEEVEDDELIIMLSINPINSDNLCGDGINCSSSLGSHSPVLPSSSTPSTPIRISKDPYTKIKIKMNGKNEQQQKKKKSSTNPPKRRREDPLLLDFHPNCEQESERENSENNNNKE